MMSDGVDDHNDHDDHGDDKDEHVSPRCRPSVDVADDAGANAVLANGGMENFMPVGRRAQR